MIKLPNDPREALRQVAGYLRTQRQEPQRAVREDGELVGYWQCTDWLNGLLEIAKECDEVADHVACCVRCGERIRGVGMMTATLCGLCADDERNGR